jgi:hypothetical protein
MLVTVAANVLVAQAGIVALRERLVIRAGTTVRILVALTVATALETMME